MIKGYLFRYNSIGLSKFTIVCLLFTFFLLYGFKSKAQNITPAFRLPAEFEEQQAIWFGWEKEDVKIQMTVANIIQSLSEKININIAVSSAEDLEAASLFLELNDVNSERVRFYPFSGVRLWIRDNGAVFVINDNGQLGAVDFEWSNYGYYDWMINQQPNRIDSINVLKKRMMTGDYSKLDAKMANLSGAIVIKSKIAMEGGALESNGKGVLIQCEDVTLQRNPGWSKKEIEAEYRRLFNIKKVIWLKHGMADDSEIYKPFGKYVTLGTGGHVDEFVRFADPNTLLISWIDEEDKNKNPLNALTYRRMNENLKILQEAVDQDGKHFKIIKVPVPSVIEWPVTVAKEVSNKEYDKIDVFNFRPLSAPKIGDKLIRVASVSYLNFLITNGAIINTSYIKYGTSAEKEERVKTILREAFPDREQIWIDALPINKIGGGIHCITLQEPLPVKKVIVTIPST